MTGEIAQTRAPRKPARLQCQLRAGDAVWPAHTTNISQTGVALRTRTGGKDALAPGDAIELALTVDADTTLEVRATIAWIDPSEIDFDGARVLGVGARFDEGPATRALLGHVEAFSHAILLLHDDAAYAKIFDGALGSRFRTIHSRSIVDALERLVYENISVIVCDESMPFPGPADFLKTVLECFPMAPWMRVVTGTAPNAEALHALINDARVFHFLAKPFGQEHLLTCLHSAVHSYTISADNAALKSELERTNLRLQRENAYLRKRVAKDDDERRLLGKSPAFLATLDDLQRVAAFDTTVHLSGETGTGKELAARALHQDSTRSKAPFVAHSCGGLTETLMQSALFGHKRGAFTGADRDRMGVFQEADKGTIFLDEVAELTPQTQVMLLRALQEREVLPVGATRPEKVDVRIVSATHKDLRAEVAAGRFREDLYYRLVVVRVKMPALRERPGDVVLLAQHFLERFCSQYNKPMPMFSDGVLQMLERYAWPGNVRELENEVERLIVMARAGEPLTSAMLSPAIRGGEPEAITLPRASDDLQNVGLFEAVSAFERRVLADTLERCAGNRSAAAKALKLPRQTLVDHLKRLGLS
ncbi:MAG: sigma 54-interacting transcriptional regulator [Deltaproteobacteria bacterium]|nr:sigma 54-interacting transcriptional regulator [Deltaproteobacteria bacterium]